MGSPVIFSGRFTKTLTDFLKLKEDVFILKGTVDPSVVAQTAPEGSLYLRFGGNFGLYVKTDNGSSVNWTQVLTNAVISSISDKQEVPAGVVNNVNTVFGLSTVPLTTGSLDVYLDGLILPSTAWSLAGANITMVTPPNFGQDLYATYSVQSATSAISDQEVPAGVVNGVNANFVISRVPLNAQSVKVYVDGLIVSNANWTFVGQTVTFNGGSIPIFGQDVYISYLYQGTAPAAIIPVNNEHVEFRVLTNGEVVAKQITLAALPADSTKVMVDVIGIGAQYFPTDYTVAANILSWNGLGMDGLVVAGDKLRIHYFS